MFNVAHSEARKGQRPSAWFLDVCLLLVELAVRNGRTNLHCFLDIHVCCCWISNEEGSGTSALFIDICLLLLIQWRGSIGSICNVSWHLFVVAEGMDASARFLDTCSLCPSQKWGRLGGHLSGSLTHDCYCRVRKVDGSDAFARVPLTHVCCSWISSEEGSCHLCMNLWHMDVIAETDVWMDPMHLIITIIIIIIHVRKFKLYITKMY